MSGGNVANRERQEARASNANQKPPPESEPKAPQRELLCTICGMPSCWRESEKG